jgi:hypothetical protein
MSRNLDQGPRATHILAIFESKAKLMSIPSERPAAPVPLPLSKVVGGTILLAVLTIAGTYIFGGFKGLSGGGVTALILGVSFSYALGVGLMVAIFYSSRYYDDSAHNAALEQFKDRPEDL